MIKFFINPILQITTSGDAIMMYDCRVVNDYYKEIYRETLKEEDKEIFVKIMESDKNAVLYIKHDKLKKLAEFRIDYQHKQPILNGICWP